MKIKKEFFLKEVGGMSIVVATGREAGRFSGMINLNKTGEFIWKCLEQETNEKEILEKILEKYDVDEETAGRDLRCILQTLREQKILEE